MKRNNIAKLSLAFILLINSFKCLAQQKVSDFKLSDFKYRTNGYKLLRIIGDAKSNFQRDKNADTLSQKRAAVYLGGEIAFRSSKSTEKWQRIINSTVALPYPNIGFTNSGVGNRETKVSNVASSVSYNDFNRMYNKKNEFIEFGGGIEYETYASKTKSATATTKNNYSDLFLEATFGVGKGRLEHVTDAQTALFILQELVDAGKAKKVDNEITNKFAQLITDLRNQRVLDLRHRTKQQIKQIDAFLRENKIISATDADEIGIINDNLYFSFNNDFSALSNVLHAGYDGRGLGNLDPASGYYSNDYIPFNAAYLFQSGGDIQVYPDYVREFGVSLIEPLNEQTLRLSGTKMFARARVMYDDRKSTNNTYDTDGKQTGIVAQIGYEKHTPIDMHWQENIVINANFLTGKNTYASTLRYFQDRLDVGNNNNRFIANLKSYYLNALYQRCYYPNGRTSIEGEAHLFATNEKYTGERNTDYKISRAQLNANIAFTYFVSYSTIVRGGVNAGFTTGKFNSKAFSQIVGGFNIGLLHTIF